MRLDGEDIFVGDSVYDLGFGDGVVVELGRKIRVKFSSLNNQVWSFDSRGIRRSAKIRQLYFHNPILTVPPRDKGRFDLVCDIAKVVAEKLGNG